MTLTELNRKIKGINANVQRVNNERQVNMGKYEALKAQLDQALAKYNQTYGVSLDLSNLDTEVTRVSGELAQQVERMEQALEKINQKDYAAAEAILGVSQEAPVPAPEEPLPTEPAPAEPQPVEEQPEQSAQPEQPVAPSPVSTPAPTPAPPVTAAPVTPATPPVQPKPEPPAAEPQFSMPPTFEKPEEDEPMPEPPAPKFNKPQSKGLSEVAKFGALPADEDDMDVPPAPPAPPAPPKKPTMTFSSIMSGSSFNPGGM